MKSKAKKEIVVGKKNGIEAAPKAENTRYVCKNGSMQKIVEPYSKEVADMLLCVGIADKEAALAVITDGLNALEPLYGKDLAQTILIQTLSSVKPKDVFEARLTVHSVCLSAHSMVSLKKAQEADLLPQAEHYLNRSAKMVRLYNETLEALNRHRRGGEQKMTVTHAVITEKAIVNNFNGMEGVSIKDERKLDVR